MVQSLVNYSHSSFAYMTLHATFVQKVPYAYAHNFLCMFNIHIADLDRIGTPRFYIYCIVFVSLPYWNDINSPK